MQRAQYPTIGCNILGKSLSAALCSVMLSVLTACGGGMSSMSSMSPTTPATPAAPAAPPPPPPTSAAASCSGTTCGMAMMTMTDAAGDFLTYQVALVSLQLQKADGTLVETLPATTAVDFVQLINLSEILSTRQIPAGEYVAAQVTVDFTNASIMVDGGTGTGVSVKPVDASGAALGQLQLMVQLDNKNDLKINAAQVSRIAFDFNLLASNLVDLTAKTDTVSPVLVASVVPIDNKQIRVRGGLSAVDTGNNDYTVNVDPFHDHDGNKLSPLVVHTTDTTTYEINGAPFAGAAGLAQLATLPANTMTVAFGSLQTTDQTFTATAVLAGSSVEGGGLDHIVGNVVARTGNMLTLHGARMNGHGGTDDDDFIAGNSTVNIAAATAVTAQGQSSPTPTHTIAEISVGSLIDAFGTSVTDHSGNVTLDATAGRVRLDFTQVQGAFNAGNAGSMTLNLVTIDRQPVSLFNFAGTGSAAGADTNPSHYVLNTGALDLSQFSAGDSVLGIGFVNRFGAAPPDFMAVTIAEVLMGGNDNCNGNSGGSGSNNCNCNTSGSNDGDGGGGNSCMCNGDGNGGSDGGGGNNCMCNGNSGGSGSNNCTCNGNSGDGNSGDGNGGSDGGNNGNCNNTAQSAQLDIDWSNPGTTAPFKSLTAADLDLDVTNANIGSKNEIQTNAQTINIKSLSTDVLIAGAGSGMTLFAITGQHGRATNNFGSFADFEAALAADLDGTTSALRLTAEGVYDAPSNTFTAQRITILLSN
jgi:hypothetical protein